MARATGSVGRQAAGLGLLAGITACAVIQEPPGGPPDFAAPVLLSVTPDSGTVADSLRAPVVFEFDEVIAEVAGGGLERLFLLSPRPEETIVSWKRKRIEVRPRGGWLDSVIYQVTMLPGITDLRNNRMENGRYVVFSTGGQIPQTRVEGEVLDWENGRVGTGASIEAILLPDSLVYEGRADSVGHFILGALPRGTYLLVGVIDGNNNGRRDPRESFDSVTLQLDSILERTLWAFQQDTVGPQVTQTTLLDSVTLRLQFNQKLMLGDPADTSIRVWSLPDTAATPVLAVWDETTYDSVAIAERAVADSVRAAAAADTSVADTTGTDVQVPADTGAPPAQVQQPQRSDSAAAPIDSTAAQRLLAARPPLRATWVIRMVNPIPPGSRYLIEAAAANLNGVVEKSRTVVVVPDRDDAR